MKYAQPRLILLLIITISFVGLFSGCAAKSSTPAQPGKLIPISKVEPRETDGKTEIVIEAAEPGLQYTPFQLTDPLRLVVDVNDADVRKLQNKIAIGKGPVVDVSLTQMDNTARFEIGLSQNADSKVYQVGTSLIVQFTES